MRVQDNIFKMLKHKTNQEYFYLASNTSEMKERDKEFLRQAAEGGHHARIT